VLLTAAVCLCVVVVVGWYDRFPGLLFLVSACFVGINFVLATVLNWKYKHLAPIGVAHPAVVVAKASEPRVEDAIEIELATVYPTPPHPAPTKEEKPVAQ
jgi:hypothetical protein